MLTIKFYLDFMARHTAHNEMFALCIFALCSAAVVAAKSGIPSQPSRALTLGNVGAALAAIPTNREIATKTAPTKKSAKSLEFAGMMARQWS